MKGCVLLQPFIIIFFIGRVLVNDKEIVPLLSGTMIHRATTYQTRDDKSKIELAKDIHLVEVL